MNVNHVARKLRKTVTPPELKDDSLEILLTYCIGAVVVPLTLLLIVLLVGVR